MKEQTRTKFPLVLRTLLKQYGITQTELARNLGLKPNTISMYCSGNSRPDMDTLLEIASYFGVSTDYLITGKNADRKANEDLDLMIFYDKISSFADDKKFLSKLKRLIEILYSIDCEVRHERTDAD